MAGFHLKTGVSRRSKFKVMGKKSDKGQRDPDLTRLTDGELHNRIERLKHLMRFQLPDGGYKLRLCLQKHLDEKKLREDLAEDGFLCNVMAGLHLKSGCFEECKDEVMEPHIVGKESDKEQRECDSDHGLTSLTDGELDDRIKRIKYLMRCQLPDGGHKLRLYLQKLLDEKNRRKDLAKVSTIREIPEDRFLDLVEKVSTNIFEFKRAYSLPKGRNNLNEKEIDVLKDCMKTHNLKKPGKKRKDEPTFKERYEPVIEDPDAIYL